jgi:hypothetical protein
VHDWCTVCTKRTVGSEIVLDAPDGTPGWRGSNGSSFRSVWRQCKFQCKIGARFVPSVPWPHKSFWMHRMVLLGDVAQMEARFGSFGDSANLESR